MSSLYKLITKTNIKSPIIAFPLVMPLIFLLLYSVLIDVGLGDDVNNKVASFYVTILSITTMQSGLMGFGINFISIKKSVLLRRIGATELTKFDVISATVLYGLTLYLISFIWIFLAMCIFTSLGVFYSAAGINNISGIENNETVAQLANWLPLVNWGKLFLITLLMIFVSYSLGMFITTIAKDDQAYMGMAMMYFFFAGMLGGLMFPGDTPDWMRYVGYIVPHSYLDPLYDWASGNEIETWEMVCGFVIPITFGSLALGGAIKLLKFD